MGTAKSADFTMYVSTRLSFIAMAEFILGMIAALNSKL